ncbi:BREX-1 system adenine-specific DNA-methyltransferase PglX [Bacillus paramycoides]|uniref:BREX-1 system adenine-specific DNA-methyltransferase PglX n=1 Tax=Bacillus paramycoides TaxID=2026194 RepID=UPI002E208AEF|nr:BREX-1 system adenine-specific DNA-methyltransferase PglX [Bacillus paramycoides]MED0986697.1 BREX-1 system adenine-specific DNA-methyltransferase PglX [Bacillus paramycoides]
MNKRALKEFAVYARNELREQIALRAQAFGITPEGSPVLVTGADYIEIKGKKYPATYKNSIQKLLKEVETKGYDNVIEEVAYTWFNRLIAIRYMEVHNYLPSKVRVLSSEMKGKVDPDILTEYQYTDLPVNKEEVASLLVQGNREEAFRKLLVAQCNELNKIMPFLFEKLSDYTELLLFGSLLHADSLINKLVNELDEVDFEEVEVIGWLYQFYMSEKKEQVGGLKNNAVKKEDLPVVTQLFTPKWIVQYMVQNSLGKLYDEWKPENNLVKDWEYYLKSAEKLPIPDVATLEEIKVIDPACGSGHILVYAFDLLYDMYLEAGYSERDIPRLIIEKNLYGLDIDRRAVQMASFALMMKGQEKHRRFLKKADDLKLNIHEFVDSESISEEALSFFAEKVEDINWIPILQEHFENAKQFGSLVIPKEPASVYGKYIKCIESYNLETVDLLEEAYIIELKEKLMPLLEQAYLLALKYEVVVTNPPYHNKYNSILKKFMNNNYKEYKSDLYSAFIYRCTKFIQKNGFSASMTPFTWMFISSHEKLRNHIVKYFSISSLVQPEYHACYDIAHVPVCTFVLQNQNEKTVGDYIRLEDFRGTELQPIKLKEAIKGTVYYRYKASNKDFTAIPGSPLAYWTSNKVRNLFENYPKLGELSLPRKGNSTSDNKRFLRLWFEVGVEQINLHCKVIDYEQTKIKRWFPYNKGGAYRKWYGNNEFLIDWKEDGKSIREIPTAVIANYDYFMKPGLTWSTISSKRFSIRIFGDGYIFDNGGCCLFTTQGERYYYLALLNSCVFHYIFGQLNPTLNFQSGEVAKFPVIYNDNVRELVDAISEKNSIISRMDWDSFEVSWDFKKHPFLTKVEEDLNLEQGYQNWKEHAEKQFLQLKRNEEELNEIFIELYGLQNELTPEVMDEEVTVRRADRVRDTKSFLSYCIGLMMGRYSLDVEGLAYAGGEWDASKYKIFQPDSDGIIPLTDTEYFEDDVVTRLQELLVLMFGQDTLADNLRWLAESLTMKNNETPVERIRRYFFDEFYSDHCKIYQKRPIYWMADSGKKKGFRALFYLHRYTPETLATMRFSYVQNLQEKLGQEQKRLDQDLVNPDLTAAMKKRYNKQLTTIKAQQDELIDFDKKMAELANQRIALDLDDGVVVNYKKIESVLAKIK